MLMKRRTGADGTQVWSCPPGGELVNGLLAMERLSVGQRCETWLVWSVELWCPAVLKLARPHQLEHPGGALAREVAALCGNRHPALPRLHHDASTAAEPHILLEYIGGPTLDEELSAEGPLDEPEVALLGTQLLTGLLALHRRGIAHVDLKPDNIVLRDMRPILVNFGSARRIGTRQPSGRPVGTAGYAAPEVETGEPVAASMDLYSLGAILHEARGGKPTFDPDLPATDRPEPTTLGETPLAELILALLHPDATKRPAAAEVLIELAGSLPEDLRPWPSWADEVAIRAVGPW